MRLTRREPCVAVRSHRGLRMSTTFCCAKARLTHALVMLFRHNKEYFLFHTSSPRLSSLLHTMTR
eukprot:331884-Pleurochrysis_carterae.AAC.1